MSFPTGRCSWCPREVVWAVTEHGKRMPVDPSPAPLGNVQLVRVKGGDPPIAIVVDELERERALIRHEQRDRGDPDEPEPFPFHVPHFVTCPNYPRRPGARR